MKRAPHSTELRPVLVCHEGWSRFKYLRVNFPVSGLFIENFDEGPAWPGGLACVHGSFVRAHKSPRGFIRKT